MVDFMDLLLAEALAAGMARQAAENAQRPPPDNFFVLPPDAQAWRKLYKACKEEHMVICVEVTEDSHPGCRRVQPLFVDLAREVSQIPFFRVKIGLGRTFDELRQDLHGIRFVPTVVVVFFDDDNVRTAHVEGEDEILLAIRTRAMHRAIKEYIDKKVKLKMAEQLAEQLFKGAIASEMEKRKRQEYENKLMIEREEMERKELERQKEERRSLEEEKELKFEAEKRELERRKQALEEKRAKVEEDLMKMDLSNCKIKEIREKMDEAGISSVGATSREDLLEKLKSKLPRLKLKLENSQQQSSDLSGYRTGQRHSYIHEVDGMSSPRGSNTEEEVTKLKRRIGQLEGTVDELEQRRQILSGERDSLETKLREKENEISRKNRDLTELRSNQRRPVASMFGSSSNSRVKELEDELLETRLLYSCTLDDMDIMGIIAKGDARGQGTVVRVKCIKPGLPNPSRVFAMKVISQVLETTTYSSVRNEFKTEYEVLSGLPRHANIIKLYAFFYDRPRTHPKLRSCGEGMALCLLMEQLSQNMLEYVSVMKRGNGLGASKAIGWLKDVIAGSHFLFSQCVLHRDMKLDNLLLCGETVKIADFGSAIRLDSTMRLPFNNVVPRGGNDAHLAPEILNTRPYPGKYLDYNKQPVWEAGVLAYELAGHRSPFERTSVDQRAYSIASLPRLASTFAQSSTNQEAFVPGYTRLVQSMLEFDPDDRPTLDELQKQISRF